MNLSVKNLSLVFAAGLWGLGQLPDSLVFGLVRNPSGPGGPDRPAPDHRALRLSNARKENYGKNLIEKSFHSLLSICYLNFPEMGFDILSISAHLEKSLCPIAIGYSEHPSRPMGHADVTVGLSSL